MYRMSDNESEPTLYESFFDDSDYDFKNFNEMNLTQLVIYKRQLKQLTSGKVLTKQQNDQIKKVIIDIWNEYPATLTNTKIEKDAIRDAKMRNLELKKYKSECFKINKIKFENSKDIINEIETIELQLRAKSEAKYKIDHKKYMMQRITCECGMDTIRSNKSHHAKSKMHLLFEAKLEAIEAEKLAKQEKLKQNKLLASKKNNGYDLDDNGKVIYPLNAEGNRCYLLDPNSKNIYPKNSDGTDIWMKDLKTGCSIRPDQEKSCLSWL